MEQNNPSGVTRCRQPVFFLSSLGLAFATILIVTTSACELPPTFGPEYYVSSTNYIADYPLAAPSVSADAKGGTALDTHAAWDWAWRGRTGNSYEYMSMTDAGTVGTTVNASDETTLAADAAVWRVELKNLFSNGNFENTDVAGLAPYVTGAGASSSFSTGGGHSNSLLLVADGDKYISWQMSDLLLDQAEIFDPKPSYYLRLMTWPNVNLPYHVGSQTDFINETTEQLIAVPSLNSIFIADRLIGLEADTLFFVSGTNQPTYIDEVRMIRADIQPILRLLLTPSDTEPGLVPGQYEFSVWIKTDPTDRPFNDSSRISENYAAYQTSLRISQLRWDATNEALESVKGWEQTYAVNEGWQRLVLRMNEFNNMERFDEASNTAVMELAISPTNPSLLDAGAILIAAPSLNFYINGFDE
ncbi:MAG: hypothetical protein KKI09_15860 [Spirochaetes bacterium]|nr:hypothetical protein [Spirochaetota bacterium]MBU0956898.1 hypothetical protein [Spirochaetota bacterium]